MKPHTRPYRIIVPPLAALATVLLLSACGGDTKQVHVTTPGVTSLQAPETPELTTTTVPNTSKAANVHISDEILKACNIPEADAYFAFDSATVTAFDVRPLNILAMCFSNGGAMAGHHLSLVGHADPRGAPDYNITLGQSRADSVATYLGNRGLPRNVMTTTSRGAMDATGTDETTWAHDRRVDVVLAD